MTFPIYYDDSYQSKFTATITEINQDIHAVTLDRTAFYPGGGGQPSDEGHFLIDEKEIKIIKIKRGPGVQFHILQDDYGLPEVGKSIQGFIDWNRRYKLMRTHTALHILCGVVFRDYGASVTGGDMEPGKGRMDFEFEIMRKELVQEIEQAVNYEVSQNHDVLATILPREQAFRIPDLIRTKINLLPEGIQEVRVVEIVGLDLQADGGTHVRNTSEVGKIRVVDYKSKGKINKRLYIEID